MKGSIDLSISAPEGVRPQTVARVLDAVEKALDDPKDGLISYKVKVGYRGKMD